MLMFFNFPMSTTENTKVKKMRAYSTDVFVVSRETAGDPWASMFVDAKLVKFAYRIIY